MGWIEDVHAVGQDYAMTATILWCGIITAEPLANQLIRRLPMAKLLAGGICIWSIVSVTEQRQSRVALANCLPQLLIGIGFSMSIPPVFALRYLLGFFESLIGECQGDHFRWTGC